MIERLATWHRAKSDSRVRTTGERVGEAESSCDPIPTPIGPLETWDRTVRA
jgi:hypothetical protein